jgi:pimeloyl-ACP methyl ester carboxylesterase
MRLPLFICILLAAFHCFGQPAPATSTPPAGELNDILKMLPKSERFEKWLTATGERAPDFEILPSQPFLPDPLRFVDGSPVQSRFQWEKRRLELLDLFKHYTLGSLPPPPGDVRAAGIQVTQEPSAIITNLFLEFGPQYRAKLHVELIVPKGKGPFPVFMTQDNHRRWALTAVSRGYIGCVYAAADSRDDTADWPAIWPEYDWSKLARRAWATSRCIDYLYKMQNVDRRRIGLTGHSRNGKLSLIAAALDPRISAVILSSSGAGGACSFRHFSETEFGEGIELITRTFPDWFHPRLRFFAGRENKLPIDQHELLACIAPRACLVSTAINDSVESVWAVEQTVQGALPVYRLCSAQSQIALRYRSGAHNISPEDLEGYLDWLDAIFGRRKSVLTDRVIYPTFAGWQAVAGEKTDVEQFPVHPTNDVLRLNNGQVVSSPIAWPARKTEIQATIRWGLGEGPARARSTPGEYGAEPAYVATLLNRASVPNGLTKSKLNFGNAIAGDLYYPTEAERNGAAPAVIWLHPISNSNGYVPGYGRGQPPHLALARQGFAVFAFDQIGNGNRLNEVTHFYERYPRWSLLGKDVADTVAAIDALETLPWIDKRRIYLLGYSAGGMVALHAAALDDRVAGVVSVAGFSPMRGSGTNSASAQHLQRWSRVLPFQPRLATFLDGGENRIPYDYDELLACIAPRTALVIRPRVDFRSDKSELLDCLASAQKAYDLFGARNALAFGETEDYDHLSPEMQQVVFDRLKIIAGLP